MHKFVEVYRKFVQGGNFIKVISLKNVQWKQGGLTDANLKIVTGEEAGIAYTDKNKVARYLGSQNLQGTDT